MRFWTSDLHFGHVNIREYCPGRLALGSSVEAMNESLMERWNATVGHGDQVIILGDAVMGKRSDTLPLLARLNGDKYLFVGNHDKPFGKKGEKWDREVAQFNAVGVQIICDENMTPMSLMIADRLVYVAHFPYQGDSHDEDRFEEYRPIDGGYPLLHGHVHDAWKVNGRQINVGCDVWDYRPASDDEIVAIVSSI